MFGKAGHDLVGEERRESAIQAGWDSGDECRFGALPHRLARLSRKPEDALPEDVAHDVGGAAHDRVGRLVGEPAS